MAIFRISESPRRDNLKTKLKLTYNWGQCLLIYFNDVWDKIHPQFASIFPVFATVTSVLLQKQWLKIPKNFNLRNITYSKMDSDFAIFLSLYPFIHPTWSLQVKLAKGKMLWTELSCLKFVCRSPNPNVTIFRIKVFRW